MKQLGSMAVLVLCVAEFVRAGPVVAEGDLWRYYKGTSYPPAQSGIAWTQTNYNDTGWGPLSPTPFGYEDSDDATVLSDMRSNYPSLFIRTTFQIANTAAVTHLTLAADYDDGFVAHLNGTEVWRQNMTNGAISQTTRALTSHEASRSTDELGNEKEFFEIPAGVLVNGTNVLAVSGHNSSISSSDFTLGIELYTNINLVRGPFVQLPSPGAVAIVWRTDALTGSQLDWGPDTNYTGGSVFSTNPVRHHLAMLTNLAPGSTNFYRLRCGGVTLDEGASFRAPCAGGQAFRFGVIGDFGDYDDAAHTQVATRVNALGLDLLLTVGDNVYDYGQAGGYDPAIFRPYAPTLRRAAMMPAIGNHDERLGNIVWFTNNFVLPGNGPAGHLESVYSYDYGDVHFVAIDSNPVDDGETNVILEIVTWFTNDLATATSFWKVVYFHHPPFTSESGHGEETGMQEHFVPHFEHYGVQLVLQGHNHHYERINPIRGVSYFVSGGGGNNLYGFVTNPPAYSAFRYNATNSYMVVEAEGKRMDLRAFDVNGNQIDRRVMDYGSPFVTEGELDSPAWGRATNGLVIHAAIRSNILYLATQDAGEGGDNFLLLAESPSSNRAAPWSKSGAVMQWSAFLADENDNGFSSWFGPGEEILDDPAVYSVMTPGTNNNAPVHNGVLEGHLNLLGHFGHFPTQLLVCAAPYGNLDGTTNFPSSQCPVNNGDGDITANEFLVLPARSLALDLPAVSAAPALATNEAGMMVLLTGGGAAPSGYPLSLLWQQTGGAAGMIGNPAASNTTFLLTNSIATNVTVTLQLTANDTRFDTTTNITLVFTPPLDTDGDGLTDQEETTGLDNLLTSFNPAGQLSTPTDADSDDDGVVDGHEAAAGTSPTNAASYLAIRTTSILPSGVVITWPSTSNRMYSVLGTTNLLNPPFVLRSNLTATPAQNTFTTPAAPARFLRIRVEP